MIECKELAGKIVSSFSIFEDGHDGPDIQMEFEDGTRFSACLKNTASIKATYSRDQGGEALILRDYSGPAVPL